MKHYSEFTEGYVLDICNALNEKGAVIDNFSKEPFSPEKFKDLTCFLQDNIIYRESLFNYLNDRGLVNRGRCPYTGKKIDLNSPSWSYFGRKVFVSKEGINMMEQEDNQNYSNIHGKTAPKSNSGCYIATACYGNAFAPEVIKLKHYRDNTLSKNFVGKLFIWFYYLISPSIAKRLEKKKKINEFIKNKFLNPIVKKIK